MTRPSHDRIVEPTPEELQWVVKGMETLLNTAGARELVAAYFDPTGPFAASTFDTLEPGPANRLTISDQLAVTFLDVRVKLLAARLILRDHAEHIEGLLADVCQEVPLWDPSDEHLASALAAWDHLDSYDGIGAVISGKLLARKRPRLVPVVDTVVRDVLLLPEDRGWTSLRAALKDTGLRRRIDAFRPATAPEQVTTIRLLDVAAWMRGSTSANAKRARAAHGIPDLPAT
jgi:hypothetical protein